MGEPGKLSLTFFGYLAAIGLLVTYLPFYMEAVGLSAVQIGLVFTGRTAVTTVAQPVVAGVADRLGRPRWVLKLALVWTFVTAAALPFVAGFAGVAGVFWTQALLLSAVVPLLDATIVRLRGSRQYGRTRLWGSVGYGSVVAGFGLLIAGQSFDLAGHLAVPVYLAMTALAAVAALTLQADPKPEALPTLGELGRHLRSRGLLFFLLVSSLHWAAGMPYNIFYGLHVEALGLSASVPGLGVMVGVGCEIAIFFYAGWLLGRRRPERWLPLIFLLSALRWWATARAESAASVIAWQAVHALSFGLWYACAMAILGRFAPLRHRSGLQGVFSAAVMGLGGMLGSSLGGVLMEHHGSRTLFQVAALTELGVLTLFLATRHTWVGMGRGSSG